MPDDAAAWRIARQSTRVRVDKTSVVAVGQDAFSVHSSAESDLRAPIAASSRSVVARSQLMPFSSCPVERYPLAERGSLSISRSFFLSCHSRIVVQTMLILPVDRRLPTLY